MRSALEMLKAAGLIAMLILGVDRANGAHLRPALGTGALAKTEAQATPVAQKKGSATASSTPNTAAPCAASADRPGQSARAPHSVTLSWRASPPVSQSSYDAVVGYFVYRSTKHNDPTAKAINNRPVPDTTCVDKQVESGKTYYYAVRGVNAEGVVGRPSKEIKVRVPR